MKVNDTVVVMRRKSRDLNQQLRDEEPELMKVFARRSLKLKESDDTGATSGEELAECSSPPHKSRDSDKENEDANSCQQPADDRKRKDSSPDSLLIVPRPFGKFQRSMSHDTVPAVANASDRRQRCKSTPDEEGRPRPPSTPAPELTSSSEGSDVAEERVAAATPFKRIQQRREEWEKRAQQAKKIHAVK